MARRGSLLLFLLLLAVNQSMHAQATHLYQVADSLKVEDSTAYYYWDNPEEVFLIDSIPAWNGHHYRPHLKEFWPGIDLGNNGSEVRPTKFNLDRSTGLRMGYHGLDSWRVRFNDLPVFKSNEAYTLLTASQGSSFTHSVASAQDNAQLNAVFNRDFSNDVNTLVTYRKVTEEGLLLQDDTDHTQFSVRINQSKQDERLRYSLAFVRNAFNKHQNGGIVTLNDYLDEKFDIRRTMAIHQPDATVRDVENSFVAALQMQLVAGKKDHGLFLENTADFNDRSYKYADHRADVLDSTYGNWQNHPDALRHYWRNRSLSSDLSLTWRSRWLQHISAGVKYSWHAIENEDDDPRLHFATLYGELDAKVGAILRLQSRAAIELLEDAGDFDLSSEITLNWTNVGHLSGHLALGLQSPEYFQQHLIFNGEVKHDSPLNKTEYFQVGGMLSIKEPGLEIEVNQFLINDWIFMNPDLEWKISDDIISLSQLTVTSTISTDHFFFMNGLLWQATEMKFMVVPKWFTRHIWYYQNRLFRKNMLLRAGVEGRWIIQDKDPVFVPILSHFMPGVQRVHDYAYSLDPFLHAKVKTFEFILKAENIESLWTELPFIYAEGYPYNDWIFRIQLNWRMMR